MQSWLEYGLIATPLSLQNQAFIANVNGKQDYNQFHTTL